MSRKKYTGFGVAEQYDDHFFVVTIPQSQKKEAEVFITEIFDFSFNDVQSGLNPYPMKGTNVALKSIITRLKWEKIENDVKAEFNRRLRKLEVKTGAWKKKGQVPVNKTFGKELTLLCWAIEDTDPALILTAVRNWLGLAPEERWWLYMMTNASSGDAILGKDKGWRKAVRYALTENPITDWSLRTNSSDIERLLSDFNEEEIFK